MLRMALSLQHIFPFKSRDLLTFGELKGCSAPILSENTSGTRGL